MCTKGHVTLNNVSIVDNDKAPISTQVATESIYYSY